jgi:hypothetical protein
LVGHACGAGEFEPPGIGQIMANSTSDTNLSETAGAADLADAPHVRDSVPTTAESTFQLMPTPVISRNQMLGSDGVALLTVAQNADVGSTDNPASSVDLSSLSTALNGQSSNNGAFVDVTNLGGGNYSATDAFNHAAWPGRPGSPAAAAPIYSDSTDTVYGTDEALGYIIKIDSVSSGGTFQSELNNSNPTALTRGPLPADLRLLPGPWDTEPQRSGRPDHRHEPGAVDGSGRRRCFATRPSSAGVFAHGIYPINGPRQKSGATAQPDDRPRHAGLRPDPLIRNREGEAQPAVDPPTNAPP